MKLNRSQTDRIPFSKLWKLIFLIGMFLFASLTTNAQNLEPLFLYNPSSTETVDRIKTEYGTLWTKGSLGWISSGFQQREGDIKDFVSLPAEGGAFLSEDNHLSLFIHAPLWDVDIPGEVNAFGVVGTQVFHSTSLTFYGNGETLWVRETVTGTDLATIEPDGGFTAAQVTPDQRKIVVAETGQLAVYEIPGGQLLNTIPLDMEETGSIKHIKAFPESDRVAIAGSRALIQLVNLSEEKAPVKFIPSAEGIKSIDLFIWGEFVLSMNTDNTVSIWNSDDHTSEWKLQEPEEGASIVDAVFGIFTQEEEQIITLYTLSSTSQIREWDVETRVVFRTIDGTRAPIIPKNIQVSPDGRIGTFNESFTEQTVIISLETGETKEIPASGSPRFYDNNRLLILQERRESSVWDLQSEPPKELWHREFDRSVTSVIEDGILKISEGTLTSSRFKIHRFNLDSGEVLPIESFDTQEGSGERLDTTREFLVRLTLLNEVVEDAHSTVRVRADLIRAFGETVEGSFEGEFTGETIDFWNNTDEGRRLSDELSLSLNQELLALGLGDTVIVWNVSSGEMVLKQSFSGSNLNHIVFSQDSSRIALQYINEDLQQIWDLSMEDPSLILETGFDGFVEIVMPLDTPIEIHHRLGAEEFIAYFDPDTAELLDEVEGRHITRRLGLPGNEPFEFELRRIGHSEGDGTRTDSYIASLDSLNSNRWIQSLDGVLMVESFVMEDPELQSRDENSIQASGIWLEDRRQVLVTIHQTYAIWDIDSLSLIESGTLDFNPVPAENSIGFRLNVAGLSDDGDRIHIRLNEEVLIERSDTLEVIETRRRLTAFIEMGTHRLLTVIPDPGMGLPTFRETIRFEGNGTSSHGEGLPNEDDPLLIDSNLSRALVKSGPEYLADTLWDLTSNTIVGRFHSRPREENSETILGNVDSFVSNARPAFSGHGKFLTLSGPEGIVFWDLGEFPPGIGVTRNEDGSASVFWNTEHTTDDGSSTTLQHSESLDPESWTDLQENTENGNLEFDLTPGSRRFFRWN